MYTPFTKEKLIENFNSKLNAVNNIKNQIDCDIIDQLVKNKSYNSAIDRVQERIKTYNALIISINELSDMYENAPTEEEMKNGKCVKF